jgi:hypothetical protein
MSHFNKHTSSLLVTLTILVLTGCGRATDDQSKSEVASATAIAQTKQDNNYVTGAEMRIVSAEQDGSARVLPRGSNVTILETKKDEKLGTLVHLGVDSDDESMPSEVWVSMSDAAKAGFEKLPESDVSDEDQVSSDSSENGAFLDVARRRSSGRRGGGGMTYCYRYVKQYLIKIGKVKSYLPGASAWMAATVLPQYGFHKTGGGPESAQLNDVCVYRGGRGGNGHAEIKVKGGWYYGYGVIGHPINRSTHPFIGCFRK